MKRTAGVTLAALLLLSSLAGCGESGSVRQRGRSGGEIVQDSVDRAENDVRKGADTVKRAGEDAADTVENGVKNGADAVGDLVEQEEGMLMAAGSRIQDVVMKLGEELGITMPEKLDEAALKDVFGLNPADIEEYYGEYSAVNTSADHLIGVKVKEGKVDTVRKALEARKEQVLKNFQEYLPDQYEKAQAGRIIEKGNYLFLVIAGDSEKGYDEQMNRAEEIVGGYFK